MLIYHNWTNNVG